jgi:hypothetical protein
LSVAGKVARARASKVDRAGARVLLERAAVQYARTKRDSELATLELAACVYDSTLTDDEREELTP